MKKKKYLLIILSAAFVLPVILVMMLAMAGTGCSSLSGRPKGPCDIYTARGYPCVTAHSTTRALYSSYNGPLYQVMRQSDGKTMDIGVVGAGKGDRGGYADAAAQDKFCEGTLCLITIIYDQSGNGNHLFQAPPGTFRGPAKGGFNTLPIADMAPVTIMGHKVYGVFIMPGMGLRNNNASGLAINDEPQGVYMVCDGTHYDHGCCFNYGNTSTNSRAVGRGTMETVYFGTATAWGKGSGPGPWIMSDMEAGLFSGYDPKENAANPTIDSWRFVTGMVNGGGGNQWEIHGGNAQEGELKTFYRGIRPHSLDNDWYYPMHRKGAVQMGNGGDNGNGSSGTFYEGVMVTGYPDEATLNAVQSNIVAARYDVQRLSLSRLTTFTPGSEQEVTLTFTNTTGASVSGLTLSITLPSGWSASEKTTGSPSFTIKNKIAAGESVNSVFKITSPEATGTGWIEGRAEWKNGKENTNQRVRNVLPVKINEVRTGTGTSPDGQFVELYNASDKETDISGWSLINTRSEWAPAKLATIPAGTKIPARGFYLLGQAASGLAAPARKGDNLIYVLNAEGFKTGQTIDIEGEKRIILKTGTAAAPMTTIFVPVSTGPWITIPAGSTNLPVINTTGFVAGEKVGIDMGGNYEVATVTTVDKASTLTTLAEAAKAGDTVIKVAANSNLTEGDTLTIGTGSRREVARIKKILSVAAGVARGGFDQMTAGGSRAGEVELSAPLKFDHMLAEDVSDRGTGISFMPPTRFEHRSGDAVQALGSGITLNKPLERDHETGTPVLNTADMSAGYQGAAKPDQWFGAPLSSSAGSIVLVDEGGTLVVDALVYGSALTNSSANGTITSPEIAILEGVQTGIGCIAVVPSAPRGFAPSAFAANQPDRSLGRYPDGKDTDSNCDDFMMQTTTTLSLSATAGSKNIKVAGISGFRAGQEIIVGQGTGSEKAVIAETGTAGGTFSGNAVAAGSMYITVTGVEGFSTGQTVTIGNGTGTETAVISSIVPVRRRFGGAGNVIPQDTIKFTAPLNFAHAAGVQVSGSGITLTTPLVRTHDRGTPVAGSVPTPGKPNHYNMKK